MALQVMFKTVMTAAGFEADSRGAAASLPAVLCRDLSPSRAAGIARWRLASKLDSRRVSRLNCRSPFLARRAGLKLMTDKMANLIITPRDLAFCMFDLREQQAEASTTILEAIELQISNVLRFLSF